MAAASSLRISTPTEPHEVEAERVAQSLTGTGAAAITSTGDHALQRACDCEEDALCRCHADRQAAGGAAAPDAIESVKAVLASPGESLAPAVRAESESFFGHSFSYVRVHRDDLASESARAVGAVAYTVGNDVVFRAGQYAPETQAGRRLLAHELTHVVQQAGGATPVELQRQADESGELEEVEDFEAEEGEEGDEDEAEDGDTPVIVVEDQEEEQGAEPEEAQETELSGVLMAQPEGGTPAQAPPKKPEKPWIKSIDVDQAKQNMTLTWSNGKTESWRVSTGKGRPNTKDDPCKSPNVNGSNCTPNGPFTVGKLGNAKTRNTKGDRMSWYVEFVPGRDIGIHDSQPVPGVPASHGCVRVGNTKADNAFAKKINKNVRPGATTVHVFGKAPTKPYKKRKKAKKPKSAPTRKR